MKHRLYLNTISDILHRIPGIFVFLVVGVYMISVAIAGTENQDKVKTAFIYQFTNYITWPPESSSGVFVISIIGISSITHELEVLAKTKTVKGQKIEIYQITDSAQLKKSNIVILSTDNQKHLEEILKKTKSTATLIVSSSNGFAEKGTMINFYTEGGRLRFEINRTVLEREKLQISSQLLKLAKLIE